MKRSFEVCLAAVVWLSALVSFGVGPTAAAQEAKRVVVLKFRGPSGGAARNHVVSALKDVSEVELWPPSSFEGLSGSAREEAAAEAQVSAWIEGSVRKKGKFLVVTVVVRDADTGQVLHEEDWRRKKKQLREIRDNFWQVMGPFILRTRPPEKEEPEVAPAPVISERAPEPPPEEPEPEPRDEGEVEPARTPSSRDPLHPALVLAIGPQLMWRKLGYEGDTTLRGYSSYGRDRGTPAFNLALNAQWYPGAHRRADWLSNIGLDFGVNYALGLKAQVDQAGKEYGTKAYELDAGLIYRLPLDMFEPRFRVGYVLQGFDVAVPSDTPLPAVKYGSIRFGAGTLVRIVDAFNFDVGFGYLLVLSTGEFGTAKYAKDLSAKAWEVGGGATVRFKEVFGIRAGVDFRRYKLDPGAAANGDGSVVLPKSATDDFLRSTLSFVYALPGVK